MYIIIQQCLETVSTNAVKTDTWNFVTLHDVAKWDISWNIMLNIYKLNLGVLDYPQFNSDFEKIIFFLLLTFT
jgi:hypothetical protein